jgi:ferredoxin-NADP reductase
MIRRALNTGTHPLHLLYAAPAPERVLYRAELDAAARAHARFGWSHVASGALEAEVRRRWVDGGADRSRHFFICGVGTSVPTLRDLLRQAGYERGAVHYEKW